MTHRDLKPDNLMISDAEELTVKLTDFGFACFYDPTKRMDLSLGTPHYMAPELCEQTAYDSKVDVWSTGVITYLLLSGKLPFDGQNLDEISHAIRRDEIMFPNAQWRNVSAEAKDFVRQCLIKN